MAYFNIEEFKEYLEDNVDDFDELSEYDIQVLFDKYLEEYDNIYETSSSDDITERDFDDYLDDTYGDVNIVGYSYSTSYAFREVDPTAYDEEYNNYVDANSDEEDVVYEWDNENYSDIEEANEAVLDYIISTI